jgi:hypothetical protein
MTGRLLLRGMIVGLIAAVFAFGVARVVGEPQLDRAIALEAASAEAGGAADAATTGGTAHSHDHAAPDAGTGDAAHEAGHAGAHPGIFSRRAQSGLGLFTGLAIYGAAFGGLLALVFAFAWGRTFDLGPRGTAALLACLGFVALVLVPGLIYPANPPAVGDPDTIGLRTRLYFGMMALSVAGMVLAVWAARALHSRLDAWTAAVLAGFGYAASMFVVALGLPAAAEAPPGFPAELLWQFRIAGLGIQAVLWAGIGIGFGLAAGALLLRRTGATAPGHRAAP